MIGLRVFAIVAIVATVLLGVSACGGSPPPSQLGGGCGNVDDCILGLACCDDNTCQYCCEDINCGYGEKCVNYECVLREGPPPGVPPGSQGVDGECYTDTECLSELYCCDDYSCQKCCYDMHCDQGENCKNYKCVAKEESPEPELVGQVPAPEPEEEAQPTPAPETEPECTVDEDCADGLLCVDGQCAEPSPDAELVLPFILGEFQEEYNHCFDSGDPVALAKIFHDSVNDLYSPDQCQVYADSVIGTHINIKITGWTGPGPFSWMIDGHSILIDDAYTVQVDFTRDTTITSQLEFNPAVRADGSLGLLTDCGDPLPLPVKPECTANQDCDGGECVDGQCVEYVDITVTGSLPPPRPYEGDVLFDYIQVVPGTLFDLQPWYKEDLSALQQTLDQSVASGKLQEDGTFSVSVPPGPHIFLAGWHGPPGGPPYQILVVEFDAKDGGPVQLGWVDGSS